MSEFTRTTQRSQGFTGVVASIGMLTFRIDAATVGKPNAAPDTQFKKVCPHEDHGDDPVRPVQRYICVDNPDHRSDQDDLPGYTSGELHRARMVQVEPADDQPDDTEVWVKAADEDIAEAKTGGLEPGHIDFRVHPAWQVDAVCLPGDHKLRLRPAKIKSKVHSKDLEVYAVLATVLAQSPHLALIGSMVVRETRRVYRLSVWGSQLILTEVILPSELADRDVLDPAGVSPVEVDMLGQILAGAQIDFDEDMHRYDVAAAVAALMERNAEVLAGRDADVVPMKSTGGAATVDLTGLLTQMLEASKAA